MSATKLWAYEEKYPKGEGNEKKLSVARTEGELQDLRQGCAKSRQGRNRTGTGVAPRSYTRSTGEGKGTG